MSLPCHLTRRLYSLIYCNSLSLSIQIQDKPKMLFLLTFHCYSVLDLSNPYSHLVLSLFTFHYIINPPQHYNCVVSIDIMPQVQHRRQVTSDPVEAGIWFFCQIFAAPSLFIPSWIPLFTM